MSTPIYSAAPGFSAAVAHQYPSAAAVGNNNNAASSNSAGNTPGTTHAAPVNTNHYHYDLQRQMTPTLQQQQNSQQLYYPQPQLGQYYQSNHFGSLQSSTPPPPPPPPASSQSMNGIGGAGVGANDLYQQYQPPPPPPTHHQLPLQQYMSAPPPPPATAYHHNQYAQFTQPPPPPAPNAMHQAYQVTDPTGQMAPPGAKPKVTTTLWEDEGTLCFQVEANGFCVARREDNDMINGTKLLNVAGMTRGRRDGILKGEKNRHVVKAGAMHLKGVWIPYERAIDFANKEKITDLLYPLFVNDIKSVLYHPTNYNRAAPVLSAASEKKKDELQSPQLKKSPELKQEYYQPAPQQQQQQQQPNRYTTQSPAPAPAAAPAPAPQQQYQLPQINQQFNHGYNLPYPQQTQPQQPQNQQHSMTQPQATQSVPSTTSNDQPPPQQQSTPPTAQSAASSTSTENNNSAGSDYGATTTPLTDSLPHTPASTSLPMQQSIEDATSKPPMQHPQHHQLNGLAISTTTSPRLPTTGETRTADDAGVGADDNQDHQAKRTKVSDE